MGHFSGSAHRFLSDAERFTEEIAKGTLPKWKIMGRVISLNSRRGMLNSRLQRTQERQQKLMEQLGYDPQADSEPKRRRSKSKDETP